MPLNRLLLALVLGGSLHAAPLSITFLDFDPVSFVETFAVDGPRGQEIHELPGPSEPSVRTILQNDRWQILLRSEHDLNAPIWFLINYGRGPGTYGVNERVEFLSFVNPLDVPGYAPPFGLCCPVLTGQHHTEFLSLDNSGIATGEAVFDMVDFTSVPSGDLVVLEVRAPFTENFGANPFFTPIPEPGTLALVGMGIVAWWVRRCLRRCLT